jgi:hypothetical protein
MSIILFLICSLLSCASVATKDQLAQVDSLHQPQFSISSAEESSNIVFSVELQHEVLHPCISIGASQSKVRLLISRLLLENLVSRGEANPNGYQGRYRNDLLARRANGILLSASEINDGYGCKQIEKRIPFDSDYLLGALLDSGQVVAMNIDTGKSMKTGTAEFYNLAGVKGEVYYSINGQFILTYETWIR